MIAIKLLKGGLKYKRPGKSATVNFPEHSLVAVLRPSLYSITVSGQSKLLSQFGNRNTRDIETQSAVKQSDNQQTGSLSLVKRSLQTFFAV